VRAHSALDNGDGTMSGTDPAFALMLLEAHDDDAIRALADALASSHPDVAAALRAALAAAAPDRMTPRPC
jgi:hypothetical protein